MEDLREQPGNLSKPNYGMDAPEIVRRWGVYGVLVLVATVLLDRSLADGWVSTVVVSLGIATGFFLLTPVVTIPLGSLFFKFKARDWLFANVPMKGDERVLDVGCGHGLLLIAAAKRLTSGKVLGLDFWVQADQANNSRQATLLNAQIEGVQDKIEVHDADMRQMPFADGTFDLIISSWAIHNIYDRPEREKALNEIVRVLKPGGRIAILDIDHAPSYSKFFSNNGINVELLGPRYTFGNRTYLVLGTKH